MRFPGAGAARRQRGRVPRHQRAGAPRGGAPRLRRQRLARAAHAARRDPRLRRDPARERLARPTRSAAPISRSSTATRSASPTSSTTCSSSRRVERGRLRLEPVELDVGAAGRFADPRLAARGLRERAARASTTAPRARRGACADPRALEQILINLLDNAMKYTEPGGRIEVQVEDAGAKLRVRVRDTGIGIPEEDLGADLRALLPRRQGALARARRHRARARDREAPGAEPRRRDLGGEPRSARARPSPSPCRARNPIRRRARDR